MSNNVKNELQNRILAEIREKGSFHYSLDSAEKQKQMDAVEALIASGLIVNVAESIGYVNADAP